MSGDRAGRRYRLESMTARVGRARQYLATDDRLSRQVRAWCVDAPEGDDDRELMLTLARSLASSPDPALLRVLDIVPEPDRLTVIIEAPAAGGSGASDRTWSARELARAGATMARAFQLSATRGIEPERLTWRDVTWDAAGAIRLDPIAVYYFDPAEPEPPPAALLVANLLAQRMGAQRMGADRTLADSSTGDSTLGELRQLVARWQRTERFDLAALEAELTALGGGTPSADLPDLAALRQPEIELEPTLPLVHGSLDVDMPAHSRTLTDDLPLSGDPPLIEELSAAEAESPPPPSDAGRAARRGPRITLGDRLREARWAVIVPLAAAVLVVVLGSLAVATGRGPGAEEAARPSGGNSAGPPVEQPAPGRVTVGLQAQERSNVRVMVDGVVEFDGTLNAGQRQSWEGSEAIQVWTDKGKTLLLAVNGQNLGPYSPAMGHPDWNRIEFTFWPGSP